MEQTAQTDQTEQTQRTQQTEKTEQNKRTQQTDQIDAQDTVIMACSSLITHVNAAQKKMGTHFKIIPLDRRLHAEPLKMRESILQKMDELPEEVHTVLVAMGFCGGSWRDVTLKRRIVFPLVDDCITLLLHTDDEQHSDLKEPGHLYFRDADDQRNTFAGMLGPLCQKHGEDEGKRIFRSWFKNYTTLDVIDTGAYNCHSPAYQEAARRNAAAIGCQLALVKGSNRILEKLVSGTWDSQFFVGWPDETTTGLDFLDSFNNARK